MKPMQVLGIGLKDYSVREAMRMVDDFLQDAKVSTIGFVSMDILMAAGEDEELRTWLEAMDLTVPVSSEILQAAGIGGRSRIAEVEEGRFYRELMKKVSDENRTAFLLTEKEETTEPFLTFLQESAPGLKIVGSFAFENFSGDPDVVVNEINSTFPDLVLSRLPSPGSEQFIYDNKAKLNARLWVSLKEDFSPQDQKKPSGLARFRQWVKTKLFRHRASRFTNEQDRNEEKS